MTYIYDLDSTLFNLKHFMHDVAGLFESTGVSREEFFMLFLPYYATQSHFNHRKFAKFLARAAKRKPETIERRMHAHTKKGKDYVYPHALKLLKQTGQKGNNVLLTLGDPEWQKLKAEGAGLTKYFSKKIYIAESKINAKLPIQKTDHNVIFINDKLSENLELKKKYPRAEFIWVNRYGEKPHTKMRTVTHLKELLGTI